MADTRKSRVEITGLIRSRVAAGALPHVHVDKVWAGKGNGKPCYACDDPITSVEIETEIELAGAVALRFHQSCLQIWQDEVDKIKQGASSQGRASS